MSIQRLTTAKRVVIKIGSALLVDQKSGTVHRKWLDALAADVARMRARGQEVILVSSGAIAVGRRYLGLADGKLNLDEKQAAAATGQIRLAHAFQEVLGAENITVAQMLVTLEDTENRKRYLNALATLEALLRLGAIPLINENDTVATDEIRFGDNDRLGARIATMASADVLVLLSDIDGLYTADPGKDASARHIPEVTEITPEIEAMAAPPSSAVGSGGMVTKIKAAQICLSGNTAMVIAKGDVMGPVKALEDGARSTWFIPQGTPQCARKAWIANSLNATGALILDDGALSALKSGKSLLPVGVKDVHGNFQKGDAVEIKDAKGCILARGLVSYSAEEARKIKGLRSSDMEAALGYSGPDALVHRNNLVLADA